jgi:putative DNA primase/helicase
MDKPKGNVIKIKPDHKNIKNSEISRDQIIKAANEGQKGCARLFYKLFKDRYCYDHGSKCWYEFVDHYWRQDSILTVIESLSEVQKLFDDTLAEVSRDVIHAGNERAQTTDGHEIKKIESKISLLKTNQKTIKSIKKSLNSLAYRKQVVEFAAIGKKSLGISGEAWDLHPWLLACENGVVDLKTGNLRDGKPGDYIRAFCPTTYDPLAECPNFENFLFEIIGDSAEVFLFVQTLFGAALIGQGNLKQYVIIFSGQGRNGKDTLISAIAHTLGSNLASSIQSELLLDSRKGARSSQGPSPDKMRLRGLRLAFCNETSQGQKFNSGMVKMLSGGGQMSARPLHGAEVIWEQTHLLLLMTNHKPSAPVDDYAFWQRIKPVHFPLSFVDDPQEENERKQKPNLSATLKQEAAGILTWMINGCLEYQRQGCALKDPEAVKAESREYLNEVDLIGKFIEECCFKGKTAEVLRAAAYAAYRKWAEENGHWPVSNTAFGTYMNKRFYIDKNKKDSKNSRGQRIYPGVGLLQE